MFGPFEGGFLEPRSSLGAAPDLYKVTEGPEEIVFMMPAPGLTEGQLSVKVRDNRLLIVKSNIATIFTPRFRFLFRLPSNVKKEDIEAFTNEGILYLRLTKNNL